MFKKHREKLNKVLKTNQVILAYLFGSEVKGISHRESDVDIGVLFDKKVKPGDYLKLEGG